MAINPYIDSEIKRKAEAGIALDTPDEEKSALYKQYQDNLDRHIKEKAEAGIAMDSSNAYKDSRYQFYQDNVKRHIADKAATGQGLDAPNDWKQSIYDEYRKAETPQYQAPEQEKVENNYWQSILDQSSGYLNDIYEKQKAAQLEQLKATRDKAIREIEQQKNETAPEYQDKRNQADVVNAQNAQRLREMMAAAGLTSSGENVTAQTSLNNQRLNSLNALNLEEQQTMDDYNRRITDLNDPTSENAMIAAIEAERSKALFDAYQNAQQFGYQQYRDAIGDNRYTDETAYERYLNELNQRNYLDDRNYGRQRDEKTDQQWKDSFGYQKERDAVGDSQWQQQFDREGKQYEEEKAWREYTYNNMSETEKQQLDWAKEQFGEEMAWKMYELEYNGELQKSISQSELNAYQSGFNGGGEGVEYSAGTDAYQQNLAAAQEKYGIPDEAIPYLNYIIEHESSFNPNAQNPNSSAYGYGQFINSTRQAYENKYGVSYSDPVNQIYLTYRYTVDRYGGPAQAVAFWKQNNWY